MKKTKPLLPVMRRRMESLGERLKLARLRRQITASLLAERTGISRATLHKIEKGDPSVAMGHYAGVLRVLGLDADLEICWPGRTNSDADCRMTAC